MIGDVIASTIRMTIPLMTVIDVAAVAGIMIEETATIVVNTPTMIPEMMAGGETTKLGIANALIRKMIPETGAVPRSIGVRRVIIAIAAVEVEATAESEAVAAEGRKSHHPREDETAVVVQMNGQAVTKNDPNTIIHQLIIHKHHIIMKVNNSNISICTGSHPTFVYASSPKKYPNTTSKRASFKMSFKPNQETADPKRYCSWTMTEQY